MAHECRTPLTGIRFEAEGCERLLAKLPASPARDKLVASHNRVRQHITSANSVIDLLLSNVAQHHRGNAPTELHRMSKIVGMAIDRYHFKQHQRDLMRSDVTEDFEFRGSDLLMTHVLFNLMKNGLRAIEARDGDSNCLSIELKRGAEDEQRDRHRHRRGHPAGDPQLRVHSVRVGAAARRRHRPRIVILPDDY